MKKSVFLLFFSSQSPRSLPFSKVKIEKNLTIETWQFLKIFTCQSLMRIATKESKRCHTIVRFIIFIVQIRLGVCVCRQCSNLNFCFFYSIWYKFICNLFDKHFIIHWPGVWNGVTVTLKRMCINFNFK
jgi:hypothetical protein